MDPIYTVIICECVIVSIGMIFHVHSNPVISDESKKWFTLVYFCTAIGAVSEFTSRYMDLYPSNNTLHLIVKVLEFCVTPMFPVLLAYGCGLRNKFRLALPIALAHAVIEIVLAPSGKIIMIGADGVYHRGDWYEIYIFFYFLSTIYLLTMLLELSRHFQKRDLSTIFTAFLCAMCAIGPSLINSSIRTSFLGITLSSVILYMYYEGLTMQDMSAEIEAKNKHIRESQESLIMGIADLIDCRDGSTGDHVKNTADYVKLLTDAAIQEGIYPEVIDEHFEEILVQAAPLHDIGKIAVPDSILQKPGRFTPEEYEIMKRHAPEGGRIVNDLLNGIADEEYSQIAFDVANYHHERWDGTGYPDGLKGEEIPVSARIMSIADVYDALIMERVYKKPYSKEKALEIIESECGQQFDPVLASLFVQIMRE